MNMQWFKHDTDATQDAKLKKLIIKYGDRGYAIYFHCLELIAADISESNLTFELEHDSEIIADNLHIKGTAEKSGIAIVEEIMQYILALDLFQEAEGHIFCFKLLKRIDLSMTSNPRFREMITQSKGNHDIVMIPSCKPSSLQANKQDNNRADKPPVHKFIKPDVSEVKQYCQERRNKVDAEGFMAHYDSNGWRVGKNAMRDWRAAVRTWERTDYGNKPELQGTLAQRPDAKTKEEQEAWSRELDKRGELPDLDFRAAVNGTPLAHIFKGEL